MNLNHLRVFAGVAAEGSLTRAAKTLRITQPAVTKQVKELEADLGQALFDRLPRGVRLTAAGEILYSHAQRILSAEDAAHAELRHLDNLERGRLSIGASTTIGSYLVPSLFGELHRSHPQIELDLQIANTSVIQAAVLDNRVDLGLTEGLVTSDSLEVEVVARDEMLAIAAPGHPLLARAPVQARELARVPLLLREQGSGTREVIEAALLAKGLRVTPIMSLGSTEALKSAVLHGLGIAIVSRLTATHELRSGLLAELPIADLHIRRDLRLIRLKGKHQSPATRAFLELLHLRQHTLRAAERGDVYAI
jgi:DNA-binding transcriptional LysR family regulator